MSPTNFQTMCLTPRAAGLLREAVRYSDAAGVSSFSQVARGDLNYALALHEQRGGGDLYLLNYPSMRNMASGITWTAANAGPQELRSSFRTLHRVFEKFGAVLRKVDAEKMTRRLQEVSARWRESGCKHDELPALYNDLYKPFAELVRENADFVMSDGVEHWVDVLINNIDIVDAFRRHEELTMECKDVFDAMYTALGIQELYKSLVNIYSDIFASDYESVIYALTADGRDNMAGMISADYSLSGLCLMSEHGDSITLALGRAADYVRRKDKYAVRYLRQMEGWLNSNPVAERARLLLLWHAIRNVEAIPDELDELFRNVCQRIVDLDKKLIAKAAKNPSHAAAFGSN